VVFILFYFFFKKDLSPIVDRGQEGEEDAYQGSGSVEDRTVAGGGSPGVENTSVAMSVEDQQEQREAMVMQVHMRDSKS
jgi:hypothetical protein